MHKEYIAQQKLFCSNCQQLHPSLKVIPALRSELIWFMRMVGCCLLNSASWNPKKNLTGSFQTSVTFLWFWGLFIYSILVLLLLQYFLDIFLSLFFSFSLALIILANFSISVTLARNCVIKAKTVHKVFSPGIHSRQLWSILRKALCLCKDLWLDPRISSIISEPIPFLKILGCLWSSSVLAELREVLHFQWDHCAFKDWLSF